MEASPKFCYWAKADVARAFREARFYSGTDLTKVAIASRFADDQTDELTAGYPMILETFIATVLEKLNLTLPPCKRALYYVYTPDYTYMHSGVRCLHLLCHHLNRLGYRSYVSTKVTNPEFNTPFADTSMLEQFRQSGQIDIVIYPEIVNGNPLNAPRIVRYLLNQPGFFTGIGVEGYGANDFFLHFADEFVPTGLKSQKLRIPLVDQDIYRLPQAPVAREICTIYSDRYQPDTASFPDWAKNGTIISHSNPRDPSSLANLYQRSRVFITGERSSACNEAIQCGCPVLIIPNEKFNHAPVVDFYAGCGFCIGFDQDGLQQATKTVMLAIEMYSKQFRGWDRSIPAFADSACKFFRGREGIS